MGLNVWTYWEGPRNPFIDTCLRSMERVCDGDTKFRLLTPENLEEHLGGSLHPNYRHIGNIAMKAGALRVAILVRHGGFWWDADTIGLRNPAELLHQYPDAAALYTTWDRPPLRALNGYIYVRYHCTAAEEWLRQVNHRLRTQCKHPVVWTELGEKMLTSILVHSPKAWRVSRKIFLPIDVDSHVGWFFEKRDPADWINDESKPWPVCFGLNQSWFWYHKRAEMSKTPQQWKESPLLIHRLLTWALERLGE